METVCAEIKQSAEDRRTALIKIHVGRLQDKQKEVTELTEELMQLKEVIAAMQTPQADLILEDQMCFKKSLKTKLENERRSMYLIFQRW